jgi:hypothetical protein
MKTFAVMSGILVTNCIVADDISVSEDLGLKLIEYTFENPAGIGYIYDEQTGLFSPPVITEDIGSV